MSLKTVLACFLKGSSKTVREVGMGALDHLSIPSLSFSLPNTFPEEKSSRLLKPPNSSKMNIFPNCPKKRSFNWIVSRTALALFLVYISIRCKGAKIDFLAHAPVTQRVCCLQLSLNELLLIEREGILDVFNVLCHQSYGLSILSFERVNKFAFFGLLKERGYYTW